MVQNLGKGLELGNVMQEVSLGGQGGVCWTVGGYFKAGGTICLLDMVSMMKA